MAISRVCKTYARITIGVVMLVSLALLVAYFINASAIQAKLGKELISPYACLAFLFLGTSFFLQQKANTTSQLLSQACALAPIFIGLMIVVLKHNPLYPHSIWSFSHVSYPTALNVILVGCGLLFLHTARLVMAAHACILIAFCIAFSLIIGFFEGLYYQPFISDTPYATFVIAIGWSLLCSAFLLHPPFVGFSRLLFSSSLGGKTLRRLLLTLVSILIVLSWGALVSRKEFGVDLPGKTEIFGFIALTIFVLVAWQVSHWVAARDAHKIRGKKVLDTTRALLGRLDKQLDGEKPLSAEVLKTVAETLNADVAELWLYDPAQGDLRCEMVWPSRYDSLMQNHTLKPGVDICGHIFSKRQTLSIDDVRKVPLYANSAWAKPLTIGHVIGFPLLSEKECAGVILISKLEDEKFSKEIEHLVPTIGVIVGHYLKLKKREEQQTEMAALVESSEAAFYKQDLNGTILSWNKGAQKTYGYTPEEVIGRHMSLLFPEEKLNDLNWILEKIRKGESVSDFETAQKRKKGGIFDASVTVSPIFDENQRVKGIAVAVQDISEMKEYARKLEEKQTELQRKSDALQESNRELEQFTSIVSHDLQEPLRKIKNFGHLIQEKKSDLNPDVAEYFNRIMNGAEKMSVWLASLLELSKAGQKGFRKERVDLNQIASNVLADFELIIRKTKASVTIEKLPEVEADPTLMYQLFWNLLSNSLKFSKVDHPPVVVIQGEQKGNLAKILVTDNGIGIPPKYKEKIFTPFFRVEGEKAFAGTGIGLSICKKIVERHKGHIYAESSEHLGTVIVIGLPISSPAEEEVR